MVVVSTHSHEGLDGTSPLLWFPRLSDLPEIFRLIGNLQVIMETSIASEAAMFAIENAPLLQAERGGEPLRGPSEVAWASKDLAPLFLFLVTR